jgi:hypothetical protein
MDNAPHLSDVQQLNLNFLLTVQAALKQDRLTASFKFHLDAESAALLPSMSVRDLIVLAENMAHESVCQPIGNLPALLTAPRSLAGMLCTAGASRAAVNAPAGPPGMVTG